MDAYQDLLNERNKLAAQVAAQAVEINALEQSTAVRIGKRFQRFSPLMHSAMRWARVVRNWHRKMKRPTRVSAVVTQTEPQSVMGRDDRPTVMVLVCASAATPRFLFAQALMRQLRHSYRVVAVVVGNQDLDLGDAADIVAGPLVIGEDNYAKALGTAESLAATYQPRFAIATSGNAAHLGMTLSSAGVPVIALMNELPSILTIPSNNAQTLMDRADDIIFSCKAVEDLYRPFYKRMDYRRTHVMFPAQDGAGPPRLRLRERLHYIEGDCFLVAGLGAVEYRSGVDAFVSTASALREQYPHIKFHFVWTGTAFDAAYSTYIDEQVGRAGLKPFVSLLYQVNDSQIIYDDIDLVYVTARLNYLPDPAVDYAAAGKPVICFANTGGIAEILAGDDSTSRVVVPHMDIAAAAKVLGVLANDPAICLTLGKAAQARVLEACALVPYAQKLVALGEEAAAARTKHTDTAKLLAQPGNFDVDLYAGKLVAQGNREKVISEYLDRLYHDGYRKRVLAGFHPEYYADHAPEAKLQRLDPLTHYLKAGRPYGPWIHKVIRLDKQTHPVAQTATVALHGHFFYVDQIGSLLESLAANRCRADLFLTTGSEGNRRILQDACRDYKNGSVTIDIVPNKGRDIGPFLYLYRTLLHGKYDFIGHVHGKKSLHAKWDPSYGERWRNFLFQHLIGPKLPVMDMVLEAFQTDKKIGMIFPEDPTVFGWDNNQEHAKRLCERMGLTVTLPPHIDFPIGTMFWARDAALEPLTRLVIDWDEYPTEPLPVDGTILHALERLLPSIARAAGYEYAATYFPGISY